jgi:hypothetical protein
MPRNTRTKILGKLSHRAQERRGDGLTTLEHTLHQEWLNLEQQSAPQVLRMWIAGHHRFTASQVPQAS